MNTLEFAFRTGRISVDYTKCRDCRSVACVKADSLFGTSVLSLQEGLPALGCAADEAKRRCNECLACEIFCQMYGNGGLKIHMDMFGLDDYRRKAGLE